MTSDQEREFIEQVACQCWRDELVLDVEHNDTRAWETLPDVDRELYIEQAEYWTKLLRYFELRDLLSELANSPITFTGPKFVELQVPRAAVEEARAILGGANQ